MTSVASIIRARSNDIMERWADRASRAASARGLDRPALIHVMPRYLDALGRESSSEQRARLIESHFASRLREGFELAEMADEMAILGRCIAESWAGEPEASRPTGPEVEELFAELHERTAAITELFARHMRDDEQADKRNARRLDRVAVRARTEPLSAVLESLLEVVLDATAAQAAVLVLHDAHAGALEAAASVGTGREALERFVLASGSFAADVGSADEPLQLDHDRLPRSEELERVGLRAILGVRLPARYRLVGVLCIALSEDRGFAPREIRRLETIAERLLWHLDNAKLLGELRASITELRAERAIREQFVSLLAHDLRGPLSSAKMGARLLLEHPDLGPEQVRDLASRIDRNVDRTDRMIRDLLDANRIRAGEPLPLELSECDLVQIARQVTDELNAIHGDRFFVSAPDRVVGAWDAQEIQRALWNLGTNAAKYGAPGAPVTIRIAPAGDRVTLAVHNAGTPLSAEELSTLFDAYARLPDEGRRGWGLGLTLVRGAAEAHGGRAFAESDASGNTFTIELPVRALPPARSSMVTPPPPG